MRRVLLLACVSVTFSIAACGPNRSTSAIASLNPDLITEEEIVAASSNTSTAYDIIKKLRGNFLSYRGKTSLSGTSNADPTVYVDDQAYGPISSLRTIPASQVTMIRMYRSWDASTKYGMGNMGGVIAVSTKQ